MASKRFFGYLRVPLGEYASMDKYRFTHLSTTGEVIRGSVSYFNVDSSGYYDIEIEYGNVSIDSRSKDGKRWINQGVTTVNADTTATTLPALLNALVPASDELVLQLEAIQQDAEDAAVRAEAAAAKLFKGTTQDLISSDITGANVGDALETDGFTVQGDGGSGGWVKTSRTGTPETLTQGVLYDPSGSAWDYVDDIINIKSMGGNGDGVTSNNAAIDNSLALGLPIFMGQGEYANTRDANFDIYSGMRNKSGGVKYKKGTTTSPAEDFLPVLWVEKTTSSKRSDGGSEFDTAFYSKNELKADATTYGTSITGYIRSEAGDVSIPGEFIDAIAIHGSGKAIGQNGRVWGLWGQAGNQDDGSGIPSSQIVGCELNLVNKFSPQEHPEGITNVGEGPYRGLIITTADSGYGCGIGIDVGDGSGRDYGESGWWFGARLRTQGVKPSGDWKNNYLEDSCQVKIEGATNAPNRYGAISISPKFEGEGGRFTYGLKTVDANFESNAAIVLGEDHRVYFGLPQGTIKYVNMQESSMFNLHNMTLSINETQVLGTRKAAIPNATTGTEITTLNSILAAMRAHGLIET